MVNQQIIQAARRAIGKDRLPAVLGNGSGQPRVSDGTYWVRKVEAGGLSLPIKRPLAPGVSLVVADGMPCELGRDVRGREVIYPVGAQELSAANINPLTTNPGDKGIQAPVKPTDLPMFYCTKHGDSGGFPLTVVVFVPPTILDTSVVLPHVLTLDLTAEVPSAGLQCWSVVFWRTDDTLEVFSSTPVSTLDPLTNADLQEAIAQSTLGSIPVWAWLLADGQTELSLDPTKNLDMRQFVNQPPYTRAVTLTTTDATTTDIAAIPVAELQAITVHGSITGVKSDYSAAIGGTFEATFRRASGGNVTLVGSVVTNAQDDSAGTPTFTVAADTTAQTAAITIEGIAAEDWLWKCEYHVNSL